jgi:WD40 repeat protein
MSVDPEPRALHVRGEDGGGRYRVDASGALGVQVGESNTQIIYAYGRQTWADGVVPPPLATVSGVVDSPYRGLNTFEERDAPFFFGREAAATQVLARMSRQIDGSGLLVVSGVSGAGKSSLLRAGVLPRLRWIGLVSVAQASSWPCLLFTPARAPLDELAIRVARLAGADAAEVRRGLDADPAGFALTARQAALAQSGSPAADRDSPAGEHSSRLLLIIDQLEQLFTQCPDEEQRRAFITALHAAATVRHGPDHEPAALVVLGVRADFEARCADYPRLAGAIQDRYLVTSMTERQLRLAITEPARKAGSSVEDNLTDELLREIHARHPGGSSAGVLPLLSHALDQAWRTRTGDILTLADYERTGGIEGAVADSAQRAYDRLTPAQQAAARQVFTRLTACSDGGDTAARAIRAELTEGKNPAEARDVEAVLEAFAAERLLTLAAGTVEISHEILLTAWPLLRDVWLAETHGDRIVRTRLDDVAAEWTRSSRDPTYLYTGTLLAAATETAARISADPGRYPTLSHVEQDFLHASNQAHRRRARRRESIIAFLMALVIGLGLLAVAAFHSSQEAKQQRDLAASGQLINESELLGDADPSISKLLSIAAWRIRPSDQERYALLAAASRSGIASLTGHTDRVHAVAFSPDGHTLLTGSYDGTARLWDVASHHQIGASLNGHGEVYSVAFSPHGNLVATGGEDTMVRLWDVASQRQIGVPLSGHDGGVNAVAFSPDGRTLASGGADGTVRLWDVASHRQIGAFLFGDSGVVFSVAFSPDGRTLASGGADGTVRLWDVASHRQIGVPLLGHNGPVYSVAFSPDGKTLASGTADGIIRLWDVATQQITEAWPIYSAVFNLAFSPDGKLLASGNLDDKTQLWDVTTRQPIGNPLIGYSLAFSPDGTTLATGSYSHIVRLWNVLSRTGTAALTSNDGVIYAVAFSQDGKILATGSIHGTVRLWDPTTRRQAVALNGRAGTVYSVAFSPDGRMLATGNSDGTVRLWDVATRRQAVALNGRAGTVYSVAFSLDGTMLATGSNHGTVRLWDVTTRRQIGGPLKGSNREIYSVAFSRDGKTLVTGSADGAVRLWDVTTRRQIGTAMSGDTEPVYSVAFRPDGRTVATGSADDTVRLWDVHRWQQTGGPLIGHADWVRSVAFSPDGRTLVSGSKDGTVRLWDVATQQQIGDPLNGHDGDIRSVAFSPDGKTLVSGGADGTARLWDVSYLVGTAAHLCESAQASLTRNQWRQYVSPGPVYRSVCTTQRHRG